MPIEIVSGRSKSGKSEYICRRISNLVSIGEEVMLIVPEQYSHAAEKRLLSHIDAIRDNVVEVFSFAHLANATEKRMGYCTSAKINPVSKALVIKQILLNNKLDFYGNAGSKDGFADLVSGVISEFKKYMISPEDLKELSQNTDSEILRLKLRDLLRIYAEYEKEISELYADTDDVLTILAKRLNENNIYKNKHIFMDEFDSFVPQELEIIDALCTQAKSVCISLCYDKAEENTTLFMPTVNTAKMLKRKFGSLVQNTHLDTTYFSSDAIGYLEKNLYSFRGGKFCSNTDDITVHGLFNPLSEVKFCASEIKKLVRDNGYMYRDIGVVCSDVNMYKQHIERIFDFSKIEYFVDDKNSIINHHLIRFVLGIFETYINNYSYESVFNYLKACFVEAESKDIALLERFVKRANLRRSAWLSDEKWNSILNANFSQDDKSRKILCNIRDRYILPLARMHEAIKGRNTVVHDATVLYEYIVSLKMPETIAGYIEKFTDMGEVRLAKEYEKIWKIITETLDEIVLFGGNDSISPAGFYELLVTGFSQHKVGFIPSAIDGVIVGNTERTRFGNIKVLFVLGVNEGLFPLAPKPDGVLSDDDKESMKKSGKEFSVTSTIAAYHSQYSAYKAFTMPGERLYLSYSKAGNDFKPLRKSYIVDRIIKMFSIKEKTELDYDEMTFVHSFGPAKEYLCEKISAYLKGEEVDERWRDVYEFYKTDSNFAEEIDSFIRSDNFFHSISEKNLKELIPMLSYTSVSKLERYMACKYAYFIDYIMRIERVKDKAVDALDIGNITHLVLEKISLEFAKDRKTLLSSAEDAVCKRIDELVEQNFSEFSSRSDEVSPRDSYTIKRLKNSIFLCIKAIKGQILNSKFEPLGYEIEFSDTSELGPIELETSGGTTVKLTGKIDRADIYKSDEGEYVRVIDYKTGTKEMKLDEVFYGLNVQLMVYLGKLVSENPCGNYGGALYFPVSDVFVKSEKKMTEEEAKHAIDSNLKLKGIIPYDDNVLSAYESLYGDALKKGASKSKRVTISDFETIDKYLKKKLGDMCSDILSGDFEINPYKKNDFSPCDYCDYSSICRFDSSNTDCRYRYYPSISNYEEIIGEMEAMLNVDEKPTDCY